MWTVKACKLYLNKDAHPSKIKKFNQSYITLCSDPKVLYYILVRTILFWNSIKDTINDTLVAAVYCIMEEIPLILQNLFLSTWPKSVTWLEIFPYLTPTCSPTFSKPFIFPLRQMIALRLKSLPSMRAPIKPQIQTTLLETLETWGGDLCWWHWEPQNYSSSKLFLPLRRNGLKKTSKRWKGWLPV